MHEIASTFAGKTVFSILDLIGRCKRAHCYALSIYTLVGIGLPEYPLVSVK